jgi:hypothetical protein
MPCLLSRLFKLDKKLAMIPTWLHLITFVVGVAAATDLPKVDLGYAVHQGVVNVRESVFPITRIILHLV